MIMPGTGTISLRRWTVILGTVLATMMPGVAGSGWQSFPTDARWETCFTPGQDCLALLVELLGSARQEILLQGYRFTAEPIAQALAAASRRGVAVAVILDREEERAGIKAERRGKPSALGILIAAGIPVTIDDRVRIAHNKVIVIDRATLITGSFNFTQAAQLSNAENLLIVRDDPDLAREYVDNWQSRRNAARPLTVD